MDKDLADILKKANKDKKPEKVEILKVFPSNEPYDHLVFTKLTVFSGFFKILFLFIIPTSLCVGFFFKGFEGTTILTLEIYAGLLLVYFIINFFRFQKFKGWQERLPFELKGFSEMIRSKKMFCDLCWNDARITIEQNGNDAEVRTVIEAALKLFCERSQKAFYTEKIGSSSKRGRRGWKLTSDLSAEGSANVDVMRYMKDLFEKELSLIARKTNAIRSVKIELISEEFEVKIEVNTGD